MTTEKIGIQWYEGAECDTKWQNILYEVQEVHMPALFQTYVLSNA